MKEVENNSELKNLPTSQTIHLLFKKGPYHLLFVDENGQRNFGNKFTTLVYYWNNMLYLATNG